MGFILFRVCALWSLRRHVSATGTSMADDREQRMKPETDKTVEGSSSEDENSLVNSGENEVVKTFKDLVRLSHVMYFWSGEAAA